MIFNLRGPIVFKITEDALVVEVSYNFEFDICANFSSFRFFIVVTNYPAFNT